MIDWLVGKLFNLNKWKRWIQIIFNPVMLVKRIWNKTIHKILSKLFWKY